MHTCGIMKNNKEIKAEEQKIAQNMAKRKELKETKKNMPADITGHKFEEQDIDLKVSCFIGSSLLPPFLLSISLSHNRSTYFDLYYLSAN